MKLLFTESSWADYLWFRKSKKGGCGIKKPSPMLKNRQPDFTLLAVAVKTQAIDFQLQAHAWINRDVAGKNRLSATKNRGLARKNPCFATSHTPTDF